ncbi:MAG: DUF4199 domain-containing protein [Bacteroidota bacterium]
MKNIKIEIKWAIIFVVMTLFWMILEKLLGFHDKNIENHPIFSNFIAIPAITIYVFALLDKKKNFYHGKMSYGKSFISGAIITLIVTLISPLTQLTISYLITPDYFNNVIAYVVKHNLMKQIDAENYFNIKNYVIMTLIGTPVMGLLTTTLVSIFTRSK